MCDKLYAESRKPPLKTQSFRTVLALFQALGPDTVTSATGSHFCNCGELPRSTPKIGLKAIHRPPGGLALTFPPWPRNVTNEELLQKLSNAINERTGSARPCPSCAHTAWSLQPRFSLIPAQLNANQVQLGGPNFPSAVVICSHCGHTVFFNLFALGFTKEEIDQFAFTKASAETSADAKK